MWPFKRKTRSRPAPTYEEALRHSYELLKEADDDSWVAIPIRDILRWHLELGEKVQLADSGAQYDTALQQIGVSALAAEAFRKAGWVTLPTHSGFRVVVQTRQRQDRYAEAIETAQEALRQQWSGDWRTRIDTCLQLLSAQVDDDTFVDKPFIP